MQIRSSGLGGHQRSGRFVAAVTCAGSLAIGASIFSTGGFDSFVVGVFLFSVIPVIAFAVTIHAIAKHQPAARYALAALFLGFVIWLYVNTARDVQASMSSTRGVDYLFLPFYVAGAGAIAAVAGWGLRWKRSAHKRPR